VFMHNKVLRITGDHKMCIIHFTLSNSAESEVMAKIARLLVSSYSSIFACFLFN